MKIKRFVNKDPVTVKKTDTITSVAKVMRSRRIGTIIIVDKNIPVGVISSRDIVTKVVTKDLDPKTTLAGDIMALKPYKVTENDQVGTVYHALIKKDFRHAVVVKNKKLHGIVSLKHLAKAIEDQLFEAYFGKRDFSGQY